MEPIVGIVLDFFEGSGPSFPDSMERMSVTATWRALFDAVQAAGGVPLGLSRPKDPAQARELCGCIDALLLPGAPADVYPGTFGQHLNHYNSIISIQKDEADLAYLEIALETGLPILGICRGMQLVNTVLGGTMLEDIAACIGHDILHTNSVAPPWLPVHPVETVPGTVLAREMPRQVEVNSYHHQSVSRPADGLRVCAKSADGVIEAYEGTDRPVLGIQWHPEFLFERHPEHLVPFRVLVDWCRPHSGERGGDGQ